MSWFLKVCDKIVDRKSVPISGDYEIQIFVKNLRLCEELLNQAQNLEENFQNFIQKSIIINLISTLECFFKFYFKKLIEEWNFPLEKIANKIDKKIKISDLVHFQGKDIRISEIVSELFNFQDLKDIDKIFRNLLDLNSNIFDILKEFYNRNLKQDIKSVEKIYPKLQEIIEIRHSIVHDIFYEFNLENEVILNYISFIGNIIEGFADLIAEKLLEKNNERGIMHLGFLKWDLNKFDAAINCFEKTLEFEPEFPGYHFSLGHLYKIQGNLHKSIDHIRFFVEKKPDAFEGWFYLGESLLSAEDYEGAIETFSKAVEINPNDSDCLNNLAYSYYCLNRYEDAIREAEKAVENDKESVMGYWLLGTVNFEIKNYEESLRALNKGLEIVKDDICFICYKGRALMELNENDKAINFLEKAISLKPIEICIFKYLARAYHNKGEINKSISILKEGMKMAKKNNDQGEIIIIQEELDELNLKNN